MNKVIFDGFLRASADQNHPLQTNIEFVFTDFSPNKNKQAVPRSEADNIIRTGINMPIKANFMGGTIRGHTAATPVGPIISMEQKGDKIVGKAILWNDEFTDLTDYLKDASTSDDGVQFSWEIYYKSAEADTSGVMWLQDCVVAGAAIVADPAYAGRTHLLAIAEEERMTIDELQSQVTELTDKLWSMIDALYAAFALPGAVDRAKGVEEQFTTLMEAVKSSAETKKAALESALAEITAAQAELDELRKFKSDIEAENVRSEALATRRIDLKDIMSTEEFDSKADFILGLSDDQFKTYVESLSAAATKAKASVGKIITAIPDPIGSGSSTQYTLTELAEELRRVRSTK